MRCVLGMSETVVTGCADGYARMAEKPAVTLLHCGPGFANGIRQLAQCAQGEYADGEHRRRPGHLPPSFRPAPDRRHRGACACSVALGEDERLRAAGCLRRRSGGTGRADPSGTDRHADCSGRCGLERGKRPGSAIAGGGAVASGRRRCSRQWRRILRSGEPAMLLLNGQALCEAGLVAAQRIAHTTGAMLRTPTHVPRMARGRGRVPVDRMPYVVDAALNVLAGIKHVILVGAKPPVGFFAYPGKPSLMTPQDCAITRARAAGTRRRGRAAMACRRDWCAAAL